MKANEMHYFSNLFLKRTLHISDRSSPDTVYTAIVTCHAEIVNVGIIASSIYMYIVSILFSSFRRVSIVICSFLGNSPASEF